MLLWIWVLKIPPSHTDKQAFLLSGGTGNGGTGTTGDFSVGGALTVNGASNLAAPVTITDTRTNPPSPALAVLGTSSFGATTPVTISAAGVFQIASAASTALAVTGGAFITGASTFGAPVTINGGLTVQQAAQLNGGLTVQGSTTLNNLNVAGSSTFSAASFGGAVTVPSSVVTIGTSAPAPGSILTVAGQASITNLAVTNAATISQLSVTGVATVGSALTVTGTADFIAEAIFEDGLLSKAAVEVDGVLTVNGAAQLNNGLFVQGTTTLGGLVTIQQNLNVVGSSNFAAASFGGAVTVPGSQVTIGTITPVTGSILTVAGQATITNLAVTNAATIGGPLTVASGASQFSVSQTGVVGIGTNAPVAGSRLTAIGQITLGSTLNPVTITANGQVSIQNSADNALSVNGGGAFAGTVAAGDVVSSSIGFAAAPYIANLAAGSTVTVPPGTLSYCVSV